jgi:hypothetical protein
MAASVISALDGMPVLAKPEAHHKQLLCALADRKQMLTLAQLAKEAKYFCTLCGRVAAEADNVCAPVELLNIE